MKSAPGCYNVCFTVKINIPAKFSSVNPEWDIAVFKENIVSPGVRSVAPQTSVWAYACVRACVCSNYKSSTSLCFCSMIFVLYSRIFFGPNHNMRWNNRKNLNFGEAFSVLLRNLSLIFKDNLSSWKPYQMRES